MGESKFYSGGVTPPELVFTPTSSDKGWLYGTMSNMTSSDNLVFYTEVATDYRIGDVITGAQFQELEIQGPIYAPEACELPNDGAVHDYFLLEFEAFDPEQIDPETWSGTILNVGTFSTQTLPSLTVTTVASEDKHFANSTITPELPMEHIYRTAKGNILDGDEGVERWLYPGVTTEQTLSFTPNDLITPEMAPKLFTEYADADILTLVEVDADEKVVAATVLNSSNINWNDSDYTQAELEAMTKDDIAALADKLGYVDIDTSMTKEQMITEFLNQQQR